MHRCSLPRFVTVEMLLLRRYDQQVSGEAAGAQRKVAEREMQVYLHAKREADRADREYQASAEVLVHTA